MEISLKKIQAYLDGELSEQECSDVQAYLAVHLEDPEVKDLMDRSFESSRSDGDSLVEQALERTRISLGIDRDRKGRTLLWMLAAAVLLILLAIPVSLKIGYGLHKDPAPVAWNELTVPKAETRELLLPDNTLLVLNAGSRVTWPETFTGNERRIFLDGEVVAHVAKDPEKPFIIQSGDVNVRVHGTTFDLKSYRDATMMEVVLMEGSVSMDIPAAEGRREIRLTPGDIAQFDREAGDVSLGRVSPEGFKTFSDNRSFSFINIPLEDIAADLERSFGTPIVVADAKVASKRFLAFFTNGEDLDEILKLLTRNGGLRAVRSDGTIYLYGNR